MKRITVLLLVFSSLLLFACKKDNALTQGQLNAQQLSDLVKSTRVSQVYLRSAENLGSFASGTGITINGNGTASIDGSGGIVVNLGEMKFYETAGDGSGGTVLNLYF